MGVMRGCPQCRRVYECGSGFSGVEEYPVTLSECPDCGTTLEFVGLWD